MRSLIITFIALFCALPLTARAEEEAMASKKMALDVIEWVRVGSSRFSAKHVDQALLAKKKKFVLYGRVFQEMEKTGDLPAGYSLVTDQTLKDIDWSTTAMIAVGRQAPEGGFEVSVTTGHLSMIGYLVFPQGEGYKVRSNGGS